MYSISVILSIVFPSYLYYNGLKRRKNRTRQK
nr:MAG TPA: hypothetical protein [Caudoviricetes sp.]